jgi:hypothetical protein
MMHEAWCIAPQHAASAPAPARATSSIEPSAPKTYRGATQVSGEYSMLKAAAAAGFLNERDAVLESLLSIRRAGADLILSYYATDASKWMQDDL